MSVVIRNAQLVGVETHGRAFCEFEVLEFPLQIGNGSEERTTKLVVSHHWTEKAIPQVNSDLEG